MIIEYSTEVRGKVFAYRFANWEMKAIAKGLKKEVLSRMKKLEKVRNHPKNEGQATFTSQIEDIKAEIEILNDTIKEFES